MSVFGIVAEYNPFHNGHLYQLNKIRETDAAAKIIAVMSGPITQRGSLAIFDKWQRAEFAVRNGIDLVIELPTVFALRSAQFFAEGSVSLLNQLSIIDKLTFGTEADNLSELESVVNLTSNPDFTEKLQNELQTGLPYAAAVSNVIRSSDCQISADFIKAPNNILAIEYLKALKKFNSSIVPMAIKRKISDHNDLIIQGDFASASAIRQAIAENDLSKIKTAVPTDVFNCICQKATAGCIPLIDNLYRSLLTSIYNLTSTELQNIYGVSEGLENVIFDASKNCQTWDRLAKAVSSRRYPLSRIRRLLDYILLGWNKSDIEHFTNIGPQYIRVLAFNKSGQELLHSIKRNSSLPIVTKLSAELSSKQLFSHPLNDMQKMLAFDVKADDVYNLAFSDIKNAGNDWLISPRIL